MRVNPTGGVIGLHRLAQPRPGPRDHLRRRSSPTCSASTSGQVDIVHGDTGARPLRHGHLRLALARGRRLGHRQGDREDHRQGEEDRRPPDGGLRPGRRVFKDGKFTVAGTDKSVAWTDVTLAAYVPHNYPIEELEPGLEETAFYDPANFTYPAGAYACEVEVDPETGEVEVLAFAAADDFGNIVNPMIVEGQVHGGLAQGIGQALLEACRLRRHRPAPDRLVHGLRHAARRRPAELRGRPFLRHALHPQPARGEGLRRGRRHRLAAGAGQRRPRRARQRRPRHRPTSTCRSRPPGSGRRWQAAQ